MRRGRWVSATRRTAKTLVLLSVWLCVAECTPAPARFPAFAPAATNPQRLSVLTYNVYYEPADAEPTLRAIERADADIVCLQEITPAWERRLRERFSTTYPFMQFQSIDGTAGMATLSRYPLGDTETIDPIDGGWFCALRANASTPLGPVQVLNVHLRPRIRYGSKVLGHFTIGPLHVREIRALHARLATDTPTIITGDFNETTTGPAVRWLIEHGFTNTLPDPLPTWRGRIAGAPVAQRCDHVLHDESFETVSSHVIDEGSSDHLPLHAVLQRQTP